MINSTQAPVTSLSARTTTRRPRSAYNDYVAEETRSEENRCPECEARAVERASDGSTYCRECGLVRSGVPVELTEPGWRPLSERRAGPPSSVSRESVGTVIGRGGDGRKAARLIKYNNRLDHQTRALKEGLNEVRSLCSALELPETTKDHAAHLYRRSLSAQIIRGRSQESISAACVYTAARKYHQPVTLNDVADASPVEESTISGAYRVLLRELGIGLQPPEPTDFLAKVAATAGIPYRVQRRAKELLETAMADQRHVGQSPSGVAAASLYAAATSLDVNVTQVALAEAAGVGMVTISRQWQSFADYLE